MWYFENAIRILGCVSKENPKESQNGFCVSLLNRSWNIKGTEESTFRVDFSVPFTHHDPRDLGLICLVKKSDSLGFKKPILHFLKETHPYLQFRAKTRYVICLEPTILDKINETSGPPLPPFQWCQNGTFLLLRAFIVALGGWGIIVPLYFVRDCTQTTAESTKAYEQYENFTNFFRACWEFGKYKMQTAHRVQHADWVQNADWRLQTEFISHEFSLS